MRNQPPVEVWLAKLSTGACLRRPKAIVVDTEGTQIICDKHGHGCCDLTSCLEKSISSSSARRPLYLAFFRNLESQIRVLAGG